MSQVFREVWQSSPWIFAAAWFPADLENGAGDGLPKPKGLQRSASSSSSAFFRRRLTKHGRKALTSVGSPDATTQMPWEFQGHSFGSSWIFFWGGAATWELRKKGPCGKLLRLIGHFYWEMLWNGMNSVSTASWNPTLRQGCHGLNLAVHKSEVRFWNWYHTQGVYVHIEQSSKNTQSEFVGLKQSGFEHLQRFFNQPIDWYNCLIWTWVQLKLGNPKSNMRYITVTSENN